MGKFDGVLICTDLDGTLLKNDKSISQENLDAIEEIIGNSTWEKLPYNTMAGAKYKMLGMEYSL